MPTRRARSLRPPLLPRAAASEQLGVQAFREAALPYREPEKKEGRRLLREGDDDGAPIATLTRWGERPNRPGGAGAVAPTQNAPDPHRVPGRVRAEALP
jgi:hypothetical protein